MPRVIPLTLAFSGPASGSAEVADAQFRVAAIATVEHALPAWQAALATAETDWIAFVPAGAQVDGHVLGYLLPTLVSSDAVALYTDERVRITGQDAPTEVLKPGWSPRLALEGHYAGGLLAVRVDAAQRVGGLVDDDVDTFGYDLLLRLSEVGPVAHVPVTAIEQPVTRTWPATNAAVARRALERRGLQATITSGAVWQHVALDGPQPPVSIVIPTRDRLDLLRACIDSLTRLTSYPEYEVIVVDNDSEEPETLEYFATTPHRVVPCPGKFNFSDLMNVGAAAAKHPLLLLLNNDCIVEHPDWLATMVSELADPTVVSVGCLLRGVDGEPQHEGVALGLRSAQALNIEFHGYCTFDQPTRDVTGVTAACLLVRAESYNAIGGFDHELEVGFGDVDFCLRLVDAGGRIVYTPHAEVRHIGMASRHEDPHREDDALFRFRYPLHRSRERDPFVNRRIEVFEPLWVTTVESVLPPVRAGVDA